MRGSVELVQCGVGRAGPEHAAAGDALAQPLRGDVDELHLIGNSHDDVGHGLPLPDRRDRLHGIIQAL